jgi:hypothetical protein
MNGLRPYPFCKGEVELVMCLLNKSDIFAFTKGRFPGSLDLSQNFLSFSPPEVTLGIEVMLGAVFEAAG